MAELRNISLERILSESISMDLKVKWIKISKRQSWEFTVAFSSFTELSIDITKFIQH